MADPSKPASTSWADLADSGSRPATPEASPTPSSTTTTTPSTSLAAPAAVPATSATSEAEAVALEKGMAALSAKPKLGLAKDDDKGKIEVAGNKQLAVVRSFADASLKLPAPLLKGLAEELHWQAPSKIQEVALPIILAERKNLICQGQAGSGKTGCFALGMLSAIDVSQKCTQALCFAHTRELTHQTQEVLVSMGKFMGVTVGVALPNVATSPEAQIVVGTPATLKKLVTKKTIQASKIKVFVLDEADYLLENATMSADVGFVRKQCPKKCQVLFFSATWKKKAKQFALSIVDQPREEITLRKTQVAQDKIQQFYIMCKDAADKLQVLDDIYTNVSVGQTIIFGNSRVTVQKIGEKLQASEREGGLDMKVSYIFGGKESDASSMTPEQRDAEMKKFRDGISSVLCATNLIARGVDVLAVTLVINYEMPIEKEGGGNPHGGGGGRTQVDYDTYIHRIGRGGRFDREGIAVNLVTPQELAYIKALEEMWSKKVNELKKQQIPDLEGMVKELNKDDK